MDSVSDTDETKFYETDTRLRLWVAFIRDRVRDRDLENGLYESETETETLESRDTRDETRVSSVSAVFCCMLSHFLHFSLPLVTAPDLIRNQTIANRSRAGLFMGIVYNLAITTSHFNYVASIDDVDIISFDDVDIISF